MGEAMNLEQILEELRTILANKQEYTTWTVSTPHLVALVNKFVQIEREACAKIADVAEPYKCADLIRARGKV